MKIPYTLTKRTGVRPWAEKHWPHRAARLAAAVVITTVTMAFLSVSPAWAQNPTTTTLTATPTNPQFGQAVTLTATVQCSPGPATGTVEFREGTTVLGTATLSGGPPPTASITISTLTVGAHTITAHYLGDTNCDPSDSTGVTVTVAPTATTTTLTATPTNPQFGQAVTLTATVQCSPGPATGTVEFREGTTVLGTATLSGGPPPTASLTIPGLAPGAHTFTATYLGAGNCAGSTSTPLTVTIGCNTVSGILVGTQIYNQPTCLTPGTQVIGGIISTSALAINGATINGSVTVSGGTGVRICGTTVTGGLTVFSVNGVVIIGDTDPPPPPACAGNTIGGLVSLVNNVGFLEFDGNQVTLGVNIIGNTTNLQVPPENATATEIEANTITGFLSCSSNTPPPTNDGRPNTVTGTRSGQCTTL